MTKMRTANQHHPLAPERESPENSPNKHRHNIRSKVHAADREVVPDLLQSRDLSSRSYNEADQLTLDEVSLEKDTLDIPKTVAFMEESDDDSSSVTEEPKKRRCSLSIVDTVWHRFWRYANFEFNIMLNPNQVLQSRGLDEEDVERLAMRSNYSRAELCRLLERFILIKGNPSFHGCITLDQFARMPEFRYNPLRKRLMNYWRREKELQDDEISFFQFVSLLDVFSSEALKKEKLRFLYGVYDVDGDGHVSKKDLKEILKLVTKNMKNDDVDYLVQSVFQECDLNTDGHIDFSEFTKVLAQSGTKKISL